MVFDTFYFCYSLSLSLPLSLSLFLYLPRYLPPSFSLYLSLSLSLALLSSPHRPSPLLLLTSVIPQGAPLEAAFQREWLEEEIEQAKLCATQVMIFTAHPWFLKQIIEDKEDGEEMLR
jgi:hypothetical protein